MRRELALPSTSALGGQSSEAGEPLRPPSLTPSRHGGPPLHSITSSARATRVARTMRPSAFAVLRLMTSLNVATLQPRRSARPAVRLRSREPGPKPDAQMIRSRSAVVKDEMVDLAAVQFFYVAPIVGTHRGPEKNGKNLLLDCEICRWVVRKK